MSKRTGCTDQGETGRVPAVGVVDGCLAPEIYGDLGLDSASFRKRCSFRRCTVSCSAHS